MTKIEKAIKTISDIYDDYFRSETDTVNLSRYDAQLLEVHTLLENYLQEKQERDDPQPLTLEQLKERDGKPVYITTGEVIINEQFIGRLYIDDGYKCLNQENYGKTWLAYDHEPKGV